MARGLCESREQAKRLVIAGQVKVGGHVVSKPASPIDPGAEIAIAERPKFVGRGGFKLEGALDAFAIDVRGRVCLDAGASTGGFTDCLLQRGAARVHAYDVGTNQLAWKLRNDERVVVRERFNLRRLTPGDLGETVDLAVIDVSFISLRLILPPVIRTLAPGGEVVCLIKPQFELGREKVGKGGIVRDPERHREAVDGIRRFVASHCEEIRWSGLIPSPITGTDGNTEFLAWLTTGK